MDSPDGKKVGAGEPEQRDVDPVQEALAKVEAVVSRTGEYFPSDSLGQGPVGDAVSLKQVIKSMEQRLMKSLGASDSKAASLPEELESLEIEADLGRPDEMEGLSGEPDSLAKDESQEKAVAWAASTEMICLKLADGARDRGELSSDPLWTLLMATFRAGSSGALVVEERGIERSFFLDDGRIITAASTEAQDGMIEFLRGIGRLDEAHFEKARLVVGAGERLTPQILAERGIIKMSELFPLAKFHLESIVLDSFGWRNGTWRFEPGATSVEQKILIDEPVPMMIFQGMRLKARQEDVEEIVPKGCRLLAMPGGVCGLNDLRLESQELEIHRACDGKITPEDLAGRFGLEVSEISRIAAGFSLLGLVRVDSGEAYRQSSKDEL